MELTAGTFGVEVHDVVADDRHTVGLHLVTGERAGRTLEDREVLVFHIGDGGVVAVWQYLENQDTYDEFFSETLRSSSRGRCWDSWSGRYRSILCSLRSSKVWAGQIGAPGFGPVRSGSWISFVWGDAWMSSSLQAQWQ